MAQVISTIVSVVVAIGVGLLIFVGFNKALDNAVPRWHTFTAGFAAMVGLLVGGILQHNGFLLKISGLTFGDMDISGLPSIIGTAVVFGIGGYFLGKWWVPDDVVRNRVKDRLRPVVFLGPAVFFVSVTLIIPSIITLILSLRGGRRGDEGWTFSQWSGIFTNDSYFTLEGFGDIFTSRLFMIGLVGIALGGLAAWASARRISGGAEGQRATLVGRAIGILIGVVGALMVIGFIEALMRGTVEQADGTTRNNPSSIYDALTVVVSSPVLLWLGLAALLIGGFYVWNLRRKHDPTGMDWGAPGASVILATASILVLLAIFSTLRGVIWNNLWWVVTVAGLSTFLGLLLAILADRSGAERAAKALIFLPMAISMVGAAVIWQFVYEAQPTGTQTGLLNALLAWMGYTPRGFWINSSLIPWNNFFIMIILVWIQTGFAMVVLSAAIKGVPEELIEAARVDGATEVQTFWRVVIPQIITSILVVITTLVIIAMKIFDLVKATTNGANSTDVLANAMFNDLRDANFTRSSAFAVLIFLLTLPVMIYNVRRAERELRG